MECYKKGFTLVEIMVVITLITLLTTVWVFSFIHNIQKQQFRSELIMLENLTKDLDGQIGKTITDYTISFHTGTLYQVSLNKLYKDVTQNISFSGTLWTLTLSESAQGMYELFLYKDNKYVTKEFFGSGWIFVYDFQEKWNYRIEWYLNAQELNTLEIRFYSSLGYENAWEDILLTSPHRGEISANISWEKKFLQWNESVPTLSLEFEQNGILETLLFK